jgi:hypothetical protein
MGDEVDHRTVDLPLVIIDVAVGDDYGKVD